MSRLSIFLAGSPALVRALPFVLFAGLTACQGLLGEASRYWFYLAKTLLGGWLLWVVRPYIAELKWEFSWASVAVGVGVFGFWVGLDGLYPKFFAPQKPWHPHAEFDFGLAWLFFLVRLLGSTLVVPPLEEVFYRSFLYRYVAQADFLSLPLNYFRWLPFLITAVVFGMSHPEWLAGIFCGCAYQGLVCGQNRLSGAITAHAITNFLLGGWVAWKGAWHFW
jgi:CAAX prenyl protease-like protein